MNLYRSFKGTSVPSVGAYRKGREELDWVERELGEWSSLLTIDEGQGGKWVRKVREFVEKNAQDEQHVVWVNEEVIHYFFFTYHFRLGLLW
jgi:hypothetical protein